MTQSRPWMLVLLLLCACDRAAEAPPAPSSEATPIATTAPPPQDPSAPDYYPAGYAEMKVAAAIFAKETYGKLQTDYDGYDVVDCGGEFDISEINPTGDRRELAREAFAREIARHQFHLSKFYPAEVYEAPLRDYERAMLGHIAQMPSTSDYEDPQYQAWEQQSEALLQQLATALEQRRREAGVGKNPIVKLGECGAGEMPFLVRTEPADGRVWVATKFSFDLCQARKQDPWNTDRCRWTELSPTEPAYLSGRYVYQVRWRSGQQRRGLRAFDGAQAPPGDAEATEVVIRPS